MPGSAVQSRMQSESRSVREAALRHMPSQQDVRTIWSILAIASGIPLALSLSTTVLEVLANSPHALESVSQTVTFSIWLFVALYARRPAYYEATLQRRIEWHRRSRAERIRASRIFAAAAAGLLGLIFGGPILVGMILLPGQSWGAYLAQAMPILRVVATAMVAVAIVLGAVRGRSSRAHTPVV